MLSSWSFTYCLKRVILFLRESKVTWHGIGRKGGLFRTRSLLLARWKEYNIVWSCDHIFCTVSRRKSANPFSSSWHVVKLFSICITWIMTIIIDVFMFQHLRYWVYKQLLVIWLNWIACNPVSFFCGFLFSVLLGVVGEKRIRALQLHSFILPLLWHLPSISALHGQHMDSTEICLSSSQKNCHVSEKSSIFFLH